MIIECPNCHSKYQYDEQRFEGKPSKKIKCARCREIFEIHRPAPSPSADVGDSTFVSKSPEIAVETEPVSQEEKLEDDSRGAPSAPSLPTGRRLSLAVIGGPDAGSVFRISKPYMTIGRANADVTLNDHEASRQHAAVEIRDTTYLLIDLGSKNGTLFDGSEISEPVELTDKAEFQVGSSTLMLIVTDEQ